MYWKVDALDSFGHKIFTKGCIVVKRRHTICFVGHSVVEGMGSDHLHGGFRMGVINGLRDSLGAFDILKSTGPIISSEMVGNTTDDSCLAISGSLAREMYLLLNRGNPDLKADIWVLMMGANGNFSLNELNNTVNMFDKMHERNPDSRIYVLNSPPFGPQAADLQWYNKYELPDYNQGLLDTINDRSEKGYKISLVDLYSLFLKDSVFDTTLFSDFVHPNQAGYDLIATKILQIMFSEETMAIPKRKEE